MRRTSSGSSVQQWPHPCAKAEPTEWQCTCGAWVPIAYGRHPHLKTTPPAFADLHAARIAQESGLAVPDATEGETVLQYVWRTLEMPTR